MDVDDSSDDVKVWETFRGNDWDNKGEALPRDSVGYEVRVLGVKSYFMERSKCKVFPPTTRAREKKDAAAMREKAGKTQKELTGMW